MKVEFKTIVKISKKIKEYVEKHHKLPGSVSVDEVDYTYMQAGYLISKAVNNPGKSVELIKVGKAPKKMGETVDLKLTIDEYKSLAKKLSDFIEDKSHKRLPNYLSSKGKKIKQRVFIYSFSKILVFYDNEKRLPDTCKFKTSETVAKSKDTKSSSKMKYGHATKHGCDNMGQNTPYFCACHGFQEIIRNLYNIVISQKVLAKIMGTTSSGTDHQGIHTAVAWFNREYNKNLVLTERYFSDLGVEGLKKIIASDNQDFLTHIAYQLKYGHYENVNSINGSTWDIQNSLGSKCENGCYCGHKENRSFATEKAWINAKTGVKSILVFTRK